MGWHVRNGINSVSGLKIRWMHAPRYVMKQTVSASQKRKTHSSCAGEVGQWQSAPATATDSVEGYCMGWLSSYRNQRSIAKQVGSLGCHRNHRWEYIGNEEYYDANQNCEHNTVQEDIA